MTGYANAGSSDIDVKAVRAWACFDGSALPDSVVAEYGPPNGQTIRMRCGSPGGIGVLHVDTEHEILEGTADAFQNCLLDTMVHGRWDRPGSNPAYSVWAWRFGPGPNDVAEFVYQNGDGEGVTFYTRGPVSNDWVRCDAA